MTSRDAPATVARVNHPLGTHGVKGVVVSGAAQSVLFSSFNSGSSGLPLTFLKIAVSCHHTMKVP